jgi:hypothetical protein
MFPGEAARYKDELTIPGTSYIVIVRPGWLVNPGITRTVHVRLKWPIDKYVQDLQFMTAVWKKRENSHSIPFEVVYFLYGQVRIVVV